MRWRVRDAMASADESPCVSGSATLRRPWGSSSARLGWLENSLGRPPSQDVIVKSLGISFDEYDYWQKSFEANSVQSLDNAYDEYSLLFATSEENPEEQLETKELKAEIKVALETLNQREALIAQLYYVEELNIYEISDILDISTGRISQIKKKIIEKLRNEIKK